MRKFILSAASLFALGGCAWRQSVPDDCARLAASGAPDEVEALAQESGGSTVQLTHRICSNTADRLAGLPGVRHEEVGWCASQRESIAATATAIRASVGRTCLGAVDR